jgi:hypothetical protein
MVQLSLLVGQEHRGGFGGDSGFGTAGHIQAFMTGFLHRITGGLSVYYFQFFLKGQK